MHGAPRRADDSEIAHKLGYFDNGGFAAHCVYCDKDDIDLLRQSGVTPVINCGSNLKLASGIPPVYSMLERGLRPALGTDGTASNNAASMFREMYLYSCLQKQSMKEAAAVPAARALAAATEDGYAAYGFRGGTSASAASRTSSASTSTRPACAPSPTCARG